MNGPIRSFVFLTYGLSIALSLVVGATGRDESALAFPLGLASMFVPTLAVLVVGCVMGAGPPQGWDRLPLRYLLTALLLMPIVMHVVMLPVAARLWGGLPWVSWLVPQADGLYHTSAARGWGVLTPAGLFGRMVMNIVVGIGCSGPGRGVWIRYRSQSPMDLPRFRGQLSSGEERDEGARPSGQSLCAFFPCQRAGEPKRRRRAALCE